MQLEKIKLSGFKSFVDNTVIPINGNLTAIVGPNGCGKSNIIDAIRWVMGESSAKHLRGGSMTDVIFNGSASRKPVSTATVELVFNNTDNKRGGAYAQYDSISIKRQVNRDGLSQYLLNGAKCRRKDVTDLFLGTGLGARSYAIIEQGTISRMVESKPEDLRIHIEEAAGISKYKERRQETEMRMRSTRENLERLIDLRDEVEKQLNHLQKQAVKAEQYTQLRKQERRYKLELLAMRWQTYQHTGQELEQNLQAVVVEHNQLFVLVRDLETQIASQRVDYKTHQQRLEQCQGEYYQVSAEAGQLEQSIRHKEKDHDQTLLEIARLEQQAAQSQADLAGDSEALEDIQTSLLEMETTLANAQQQEHSCLQTQQQVQQLYNDWQQQWEHFRTESTRHKGQKEVQQAKIAQFEQQNRQLQSRIERLKNERDDLLASDLTDEIEILEERIAELNEQQAQVQMYLQSLSGQMTQYREQLRSVQNELKDKQSQQHSLVGKITSLELLQQHAMGKDNQKLTHWLQQMGVQQQQRLAEFVEVEAGWEVALETVLGSFLEAICVEQAKPILAGLTQLTDQSLSIIETGKSFSDFPNTSKVTAPTLISKINTPWPLSGLLGGIYCADDLETAQSLIADLQAHESVITLDGTWVGQSWSKVVRAPDSKQGVLQREQNLRAYKQQSSQLESELTALHEQLSLTELRLKETESGRDSNLQQEKSLAAELAKEQSQLHINSAKMQQQQRRLQQLDEELEDTLAESSEYAEHIIMAETLQTTANAALESLIQEQQALEQQQQQLQQQLQEAGNALQAARQAVQTQVTQRESLRASENLTVKQIERLKLVQRQTQERQDELQKNLDELLSPMDDDRFELEQLSQKKQAFEHTLQGQRQTLQESEQRVTRLQEDHVAAQRNLERLKQQLDKIRFEQQESDVRQQTVTEQLQELEADVADILKELPNDSDESVWKARLEKLSAQISNLGSINLTAIEEYQAQSERMTFLTDQYNDLTEALETLNQAIIKIDKESRLRFKETFDKINSGLQLKFPKLFGGGKAYLELTDDNLLESGVNIIAQPPGKRNSSIHLLSGGEKALTAVALVFAIFELNPAPFCLLDEVDAPLDDANVGRFSQMVADMSESVQFLYISHNKATMEIAKQLAGVTMKEPGVSRMVAVDIEEAVSLAEL